MKINNSNIAFQGIPAEPNISSVKKFTNKVINYDTLNFKAKNINFPMYAAMILFVVTGSRYIQARDKDERREILTRDVISLCTYLYATNIFMKGVASAIEKKTGFLTMFKKKVNGLNEAEKPKTNHLKSLWNKAKGYILPNGGYQLLSYNDIKNTYINNNKMSDFANLIIKNTDEKGKHLYKMLSFALGKDKAKISASDKSNNGMLNWIKSLEDTKNPLLDKIKENFKPNGIVQKKVEVLKSIPDLIALTSTIAIAGWILPWFNIQYTRALYKSGKNKSASPQQAQQSPNIPDITNNLKASQRNLFSEFIK